MRKAIHTSKAPQAIGPYSQGILIDKMIFTSGQIPIDPISGNMITDDFNLEVLQIIENIKSILEKGGSSLKDVIKYTVYMTDLSLFPVLNNIFDEIYSGDVPPARSTIQVSALPKDARVEIEAISVISNE
tara:strand:- start:329 stop:718 length:390 start_codon:yes stop_codon:yes gene_type:complete